MPVRPSLGTFGPRNLPNVPTLSTLLAPGVDVERSIPDGTFTLGGPHPGGAFTVKVSQNQALCAKNVTLRLYIDDFLVSYQLLAMSGDSSAGTDQTFVLPIPFENRPITHRYRVTWSSACGTGDLDSALRSVALTSIPNTRLPGAFGVARSIERPDRDTLSGPKLGPWWANPATTAAPVLITYPGSTGLHLSPALASKHMSGLRQRAPIGDFSVSALIRTTGPGTSDVRSGLFVGTAGSTGNVVGPFWQDSLFGAIGVSTVSDTADWSGYDGYLATVGAQPARFPSARFRIAWTLSTTTLAFAFSRDGLTWTSIGSRGSMPVPTEIGFGIYSNTGATALGESIDVAAWSVTRP